MAQAWKVTAPTVAEELPLGASLTETVERALEQDRDLCDLRFNDETLEVIDGGTLDVNGCVFEHCIFAAMGFKHVSFVDCVLDKCEWSNLRITNATFQRVSFRNCRMTGVELLRSLLMNTAFEACMLDFASFSEVKMDKVLLQECHMRESMWADVKLQKALFRSDDLSRAQWIRTPLAGMDMSSNMLDGWNISLYDLRGMKVTAAQLISLSGLLGVEMIE